MIDFIGRVFARKEIGDIRSNKQMTHHLLCIRPSIGESTIGQRHIFAGLGEAEMLHNSTDTAKHANAQHPTEGAKREPAP